MDRDAEGLRKKIEQLIQENAKLRSELIVTRLWNPPAELERAFREAYGWTCLSVPSAEGGPASTLILVAGAAPGAEPVDAGAAGRVWRYLLTAAPIRGRIGPFARASMPAHLLGYLGEQGGREVIVLNTDLTHSQLTRAARLLWSAAKSRWPSPRLLLMSVAPLPILYVLLRVSGAKSMLAAVLPAAVIAASVAVAPGQVPADITPAPPADSPFWERDHIDRAVPDRPPPPRVRPRLLPGCPARRRRHGGAGHSPGPIWTPALHRSATPPAESGDL